MAQRSDGNNQSALGRWLDKRLAAWQGQEKRLRAQRDSRAEPPAEVLALVAEHKALARDLALARTLAPQGRLTRHLEALYLRSHEVVHRGPRRFWRQLLDMLRLEVPAIFNGLRGTLAAVTAWFIATGLAGWLLVSAHPETVSLFASEAMVEHVQRGELWTDDLLNIMPSSVLAVQIMTNNIMVSLFAFALGAFYGLGTLYIIGLNGFMLGGVFAFTRLHGLDGRLFEFVITHGLVELSVIMIAGAAGVRLGEALMRPGPQRRLDAFQQAVASQGRMLVVCVLFLIGAGVLEGYVSPDQRVAMETRVVLGSAYWLLLLATLTGAIWRFGKPAKMPDYARTG